MKESVRRFEDLEAWKISRELTNRIYDITKEGPIARDYGFMNQIRRASLSTALTSSTISTVLINVQHRHPRRKPIKTLQHRHKGRSP